MIQSFFKLKLLDMKHEFVINVRRKYKINRDESLRCEILYIILYHCNRGKYTLQAMKALLDDLEKIKYEESREYSLIFLDDEYVITTNCLAGCLSGNIAHVMNKEDFEVYSKLHPETNFKTIEEHDNYFNLLS